ncbi:MAG: hypothetical protein ACOCQ4_02545 [bacterium]
MIKSIFKKVFLRIVLVLGSLIGFGLVVGLANEIVFPINILFIAAVIIIFAVLGLRCFFKGRKDIFDDFFQEKASIQTREIEKEDLFNKKSYLGNHFFAEPNYAKIAKEINYKEINYKENKFEFYHIVYSIGISVGPISYGKRGASPKINQIFINSPCVTFTDRGEINLYPAGVEAWPLMNYIVKKFGFSFISVEGYDYFYNSNLSGQRGGEILKFVRNYNLPQPYLKIHQDGVALYYWDNKISPPIFMDSLKALRQIKNIVEA